ncbi:uncharacterized protein LOC142233854 [Haematobia irritans]|uniref:uncharacterized protein LOC142223443 n=1 Tax=Haematobia irritans TaxID=7368 RepID=UPI003F5067B4
MERRGRCQLCQQNHLFKRCPEFRWMLPEERREAAKKSQVCLNCFTDWHKRAECTSENRCSVCGRRHHTMIHRDEINASSSTLEELPQNPTAQDLKGYTIEAITKHSAQGVISFHEVAQAYRQTANVGSTPRSEEARAQVERVQGVATQTSYLLRRITEYRPAIKPHGENCVAIAPVILCDIQAKKKALTVTLVLNPRVKISHIRYDVVEDLPYRAKWVKNVSYGVFQIKTKHGKSWLQDLAIVDKIQMSTPSPVDHQLLPFLLESHGVHRGMWAHPMPHDFGVIHGVIGRDLYSKVLKGLRAPLDYYPNVKVQNTEFGVVIEGCICDSRQH